MDLKVERIRANVTITSLAARMGLERAAVVDSDRAKRYREALRGVSEPSGPA
jgi:hypothetical protein